MNFKGDSYYKNYPNQRKENLVYSPTARKYRLCGPKVNGIVWAVPHKLEQDAKRLEELSLTLPMDISIELKHPL